MWTSLEVGLKRGILSSSKIVTGRCSVQLQSVRHYPRKPRWVPMAKSKMYKVIEVPAPPKYEIEEIHHQYERYNLYHRSLWNYQSTISREIEAQQRKDAIQVSEEVELERIFSMNEEENAKVRQIRENALVQEWKDIEQEILQVKRLKEEEELKRLGENEEFIKMEMERLKGAIKLEDLDDAIEKALGSEFDYNYAISKDGKYFQGRFNNTEGMEGPPPDQPTVRPLEGAK